MSMQAQASLLSPRLHRLQDELVQEKALAAFWQEIASQGTPLVEPIEGDAQHSLATFLWRATGETHGVIIASSLTGFMEGWSDKPHYLAHLPETDIWYRSYRVPNDTRTTYQIGPVDLSANEEEAHLRPDPLCKRTFVLQADPEVGDEEEVQSLVELPDAPTLKWSVAQPDVACGTLEMHRLSSDILGNTRRIWVYTPPAYDPRSTYGALLLFDGGVYTATIPTPVILDNLLAAGRIPPMIAILVCSLDWDTRERELHCNQPFVHFLTDELLPWLKQRYAVSSDPQQAIVGGSSDGGLAAAYAGLLRPDVFGNVLAQSGSCYWTPEGDEDFEWIARQYASATTLPHRFSLSVGRFENNPRRGDSGPTELAAVRHLRNILHARRCELHYQELHSGHDYCAWCGSLTASIQALTAHWNR